MHKSSAGPPPKKEAAASIGKPRQRRKNKSNNLYYITSFPSRWSDLNDNEKSLVFEHARSIAPGGLWVYVPLRPRASRDVAEYVQSVHRTSFCAYDTKFGAYGRREAEHDGGGKT